MCIFAAWQKNGNLAVSVLFYCGICLIKSFFSIMKKVFMSLAVVALMLATVSCACNNNQKKAEATEEAAKTECCDSCCAAADTTCTACDSTVVAE